MEFPLSVKSPRLPAVSDVGSLLTGACRKLIVAHSMMHLWAKQIPCVRLGERIGRFYFPRDLGVLIID